MSDRGAIVSTIPWTDTSWADQAACLGAPIGWFYPPERTPGEPCPPDETRHGKAVCRGCPVRADCLEWALETRDPWAILGGTAPWERGRIARRRRRRKTDRPREPIALCGTEGGYGRHRRVTHTDPCDDCLAAHNQAQKGRIRRRKDAPGRRA